MNPIKIPGANHTFRAPTDWKAETLGECSALEVIATEDEEGLTMLQSAWKPTAQELYQLNHGGAVILTIYGRGHPPVSLGASSQELPG